MKNTRKNKGITLVALVITIIILLILAGISISALTNTGIFKKINDAKQKSADAEKNQAKTLTDYEAAIGEYLPAEALSRKIKIGDYVEYTPDTVENTDSRYTELMTNYQNYSGTNKNTEDILKQETLKWRVLDITQTGQVRLISEEPTGTVYLSGANGYNNAVKLLDSTCNLFYNNSKFASDVQNLKIEDIRNKFSDQSVTLGDGVKTGYTGNIYDCPNIVEQEKNQKVGTTSGTTLDLSEQNDYITGSSKTETTLTNTSWKKPIEDDKNSFTDPKYYELFINNDGNDFDYWISSRAIRTREDNVSFCVFGTYGKQILAMNIYTSYSNTSTGSDSKRGIRPVVTLNANIIATAGQGTKSEPFVINTYDGNVDNYIPPKQNNVEDSGADNHTAGTIQYTWDQLSTIAQMISNNSNINENTAEINVILNGKSGTIGVGDIATVDNKRVRIIGFNHDELVNENAYGNKTATGKAGISFDYVDAAMENVTISPNASTDGGWAQFPIRSTLNGTYYENLTIKNQIKEVKKYYATKYDNGDSVEVSNDYIWLLSAGEVWTDGTSGDNSRGLSLAIEGKLYRFYKGVSFKNKDERIKKYNSKGNSVVWVLRSLYYNSDHALCSVGDDASMRADGYNSLNYIIPGFAI